MDNKAKAVVAAEVLQEGGEEIASRWLERLTARVAVEPEFVFPSEDLLDGIPELIEGAARLLRDEHRDVTADLPVILKARELGRLRYAQGFSARQIVWEYELLNAIVLQYLDERTSLLAEGFSWREHRTLSRVLSALERATVEEYLLRAEETLKERDGRLRAFNRAVTHELRSDLGAILGAARILREEFVITDPAQRERFLDIVVRNAERMELVLTNLLELARVDHDARQNRNVLLQHTAEEAARRLRGLAQAAGVRIEIGDLPRMEVNAATLDFCLTNLLVNAIKYHDPGKSDRWVRVQGSVLGGEEFDVALVEVTDNGRGVPEDERPRLFERSFRASNTGSVQGTGLGLSLVREFIERLGGRVWAEFPEGETVFAFTIPSRRAEDQKPEV